MIKNVYHFFSMSYLLILLKLHFCYHYFQRPSMRSYLTCYTSSRNNWIQPSAPSYQVSLFIIRPLVIIRAFITSNKTEYVQEAILNSPRIHMALKNKLTNKKPTTKTQQQQKTPNTTTTPLNNTPPKKPQDFSSLLSCISHSPIYLSGDLFKLFSTNLESYNHYIAIPKWFQWRF